MNYNKTNIKNITINHIQTKPFKSTKIRVAFLAPLEQKKTTLRAMLPYIMRAGSKHYPTRQDVSIKVNDMYSSRFHVGVSKKGQTHVIIFELSIIDDNYTLFGESLLEEGFHFITDIIYNPILSKDSYNDEYRLMKEYYQSIYADKMRYAIMKLQESMFKDEPYRINPLGDLETLETITYQDILDEYQSMITNDQIHITVVGNVEYDKVQKQITALFPLHSKKIPVSLIEKIDINRPVQTINIKQSVEQAKLVLGYRLNIYYKEEFYYPAILFDMLFGGTSESLLFKTLREKLGLVYSAQSSYNPYKGVFFIYAGINKEEYQNVVNAIQKLIDIVSNNDYDDIDLDIAKKQYINSLIQSYDSINGLAYKLEHTSMYDVTINMGQTIKTVQKITKKNLQEVAKRLRLDTVCLLEGDMNE